MRLNSPQINLITRACMKASRYEMEALSRLQTGKKHKTKN